MGLPAYKVTNGFKNLCERSKEYRGGCDVATPPGPPHFAVHMQEQSVNCQVNEVKYGTKLSMFLSCSILQASTEVSPKLLSNPTSGTPETCF